MADTDNRQYRVEQFYLENKVKILASARRLDKECAEDLVQAVLEIWLRPTFTPQFTVMAFVRKMELVVYTDIHYQPGAVGKKVYTKRPREVHGDIDLMWRGRHGRWTAAKWGSDGDPSTPIMKIQSGDTTRRRGPRRV